MQVPFTTIDLRLSCDPDEDVQRLQEELAQHLCDTRVSVHPKDGVLRVQFPTAQLPALWLTLAAWIGGDNHNPPAQRRPRRHGPVGSPITIGGVTYMGRAEAARAFGLSVSAITKRQASGTLEELVGGIKKMHDGYDLPITIRGETYVSQTEAAEALGVSVSLISKAKKRGTIDRVGLRAASKARAG